MERTKEELIKMHENHIVINQMYLDSLSKDPKNTDSLNLGRMYLNEIHKAAKALNELRNGANGS
jgi:hypothetical protein